MIFSVQEYKVILEYSEKVELLTNVYHENQTQLTDDEIIEEARGYFEDDGFNLDNYSKSDYFISVLTKK